MSLLSRPRRAFILLIAAAGHFAGAILRKSRDPEPLPASDRVAVLEPPTPMPMPTPTPAPATETAAAVPETLEPKAVPEDEKEKKVVLVGDYADKFVVELASSPESGRVRYLVCCGQDVGVIEDNGVAATDAEEIERRRAALARVLNTEYRGLAPDQEDIQLVGNIQGWTAPIRLQEPADKKPQFFPRPLLQMSASLHVRPQYARSRGLTGASRRRRGAAGKRRRNAGR